MYKDTKIPRWWIFKIFLTAIFRYDYMVNYQQVNFEIGIFFFVLHDFRSESRWISVLLIIIKCSQNHWILSRNLIVLSVFSFRIRSFRIGVGSREPSKLNPRPHLGSTLLHCSLVYSRPVCFNFSVVNDETTNWPIHQFMNLKCCIKAREPFETPF